LPPTSEYETTSRPEPRRFNPAPGAERSLQYSSSLKNLAPGAERSLQYSSSLKNLAPVAPVPPPAPSSTAWFMREFGKMLKRQSNEPVDEASGGAYGKKNYF
jgi:hypothetical protein